MFNEHGSFLYKIIIIYVSGKMRARILPLFIQEETSVTVNNINVEIIMIML